MNTSVKGGSSGFGIGLAAVWLAGRFGLQLGAEDGAIIAGAATAVGAFLWHVGLLGFFQHLLHGDTGE